MKRVAALMFMAVASKAHAMDKRESVDSPLWGHHYDHHFQKQAKHYFGPFFDWRWFKAQAIAESRLDPQARSPAGALGLMQILPSTYREIRQKNPKLGKIHDASWNITAAIHYDHYLYQRPAWASLEREERLLFTLAAYNAGPATIIRAINRTPGPVKSWSQVSSQAPPETRAYVARITRLRNGAHRGPQLRGVAAQFEARRRYAMEKQQHTE
jgi:membrane-bound lytic murein transglycosylase MltF